MSTPISTLPLKTQASGAATEANDINDPVVQDVLNEFQDELMMSKQAKSHPQIPPQMSHLTPQMPPHPPHPQMPSHMSHPYPYPPSPYSSRSQGNKYDNIASYVDTEVAKKSLILVILAVIIYHSGIINTVYEKLPDNLQESLNSFDIYIKSISLFSIIYVLSFFEYI
jgi:hypothetical protein